MSNLLPRTVVAALANTKGFMEFDGHILLTSDFFFKDGDDNPVAVLGCGCCYFFDAEANKRREARMARSDSTPSGEHAFECALARRLEAAGRTVRRQVATASGRIDLLLTDDPVTLIEVKAYGDARSVGYAIGQLFSYAVEYPGARLCVAVPGPIDNCMLPVLTRCGVSIWK